MTVNIQWSSDIHLDTCEESTFRQYLSEINPEFDLIISGDISKSNRIERDIERIAHKLGKSHLYFVMGNHDYYGNTINLVRYRMKFFLKSFDNITYLSQNDDTNAPIILGKQWRMIGVDGWADALAGNYNIAPTMLRDYRAIDDFQNKDDDGRFHLLNTLGQEEAHYLSEKLNTDIEQPNILIVTHVPPYPEAHMYEGRPASNAYLPHFVCVSTGRVITEYAEANPNKQIKVICGHTHHYGRLVVNNVTVEVSGAEYAKPSIQVLQLD